MESTKRVIKWGLFTVIAVSVIALASVAMSFATEEVTEEVVSETSQEAITQEEAVVEDAEAITEVNEKNSQKTIKFNVDDSSIKLGVGHTVVDSKNESWAYDEYFELDPSVGITSECTNWEYIDIIFDQYDTYAKIEFSDENWDTIEIFRIEIISGKDDIDAYFNKFKFVDESNSVVSIQYGRASVFQINAYLWDTNNDPVVNCPVPYYSSDGIKYSTVNSTDENGYVQYKNLSKEYAVGYFYDMNQDKTKCFFGFIGLLGSYRFVNDSDSNTVIGVLDSNVDLYWDDINFTMQGGEHHNNFVARLGRSIDRINWYMDYNLNNEVALSFYQLMANTRAHYSIEAKVDSDGMFSIGFIRSNYLFASSKSIKGDIYLGFLPVAQSGYEFKEWNMLGNVYGPNSKVDFNEEVLSEGFHATVNYQLAPGPEPGPEPEPSPEPAVQTGTAQTGDVTPIAGVIALGAVAAIALAISRKRIEIN